MIGDTQVNTGWGSCASCVGSTYVDQSGNATGNGSGVVTPGISVGTNNGVDCSINGWILAAAVGIVALMAANRKGAR